MGKWDASGVWTPKSGELGPGEKVIQVDPEIDEPGSVDGSGEEE